MAIENNINIHGGEKTVNYQDFCKEIIDEHLERIKHLESSVLSGEETEMLHDLRVGLRRARVAFLVFKPLFIYNFYKMIQNSLKQAGEKTGIVRDMDVLLDRIKNSDLWVSERNQNECIHFLDHIQKHRDEKKSELNAYLRSRNHQELITTIFNFIKYNQGINQDFALKHEIVDLYDYASDVLNKRLEKLNVYDQYVDKPILSKLHELRIEAKKLRYATEFFSNLLYEKGETLISKMKRLQDILGEITDIEVEIKYMHMYLEQNGNNNSCVGKLISDFESERKKLFPLLSSEWGAYRSGEIKKILFEEIHGK